MAISSQTTTVSYTGNASTVTPYPVTFRYDEAAWVTVQEIDLDGAVTTLALGSDYTLTGNGSTTTGNVVTGGGAIPATSTLRITRDTSLTQTVSLSVNGTIPSAVIEAELDKLTMSHLDQKRRQANSDARSLRVPDGETAAELPSAANRKGEIPYFNATTGAVETKTPDEILALSGGAPDGVGIPAGGTTGQALVKSSGTDYAAGWEDVTGATAASVLAADEAMTVAQKVSDWAAMETGADVEATSDLVNAQPWCMARISAWNSGTSVPLRGAYVGDSLSNTGGEFGLGPYMGRAGFIGLKILNTSKTGTVTEHSGRTRNDIWIDGTGTTFAIGSSAELGGGAGGADALRGDRACIAYIAGPGKGTFDLQYQVNGTGGWTNVTGGTGINTANATTIGVFLTFNLPTTNYPFYRLRVTNVTGGIVELAPLTGIYNSTGGGVIFINAGMQSGLDLATHVAATPTAVFAPLWAGLAPDYVVSIWADAASEWEAGGAFRAFYARAIAAKPETDWIQISRNPSNEPEGIPYSIAVAKAQAAAQRAWALETRQTFLNGHEIFGGSWTVANARGLMGDNVHPSAAGATHRNACLWPKLPLGQTYLQGGFKIGQNAAVGGTQLIASNFSQAFQLGVPFEVTGTTAAYRLWDQTYPLRGDLVGIISLVTAKLTFAQGSSIGGYFDFGSGLIGFYAGGNNWALGKAAERWKPFFAETNISGPIIQVPDTFSGAGAIPVTTPVTLYTSTGAAQALTLANGTHGQIKRIVHDVDGGSGVLTPTTRTGFSTVTFNNAGDTVTLQFFTTRGWMVIGSFGAVIA